MTNASFGSGSRTGRGGGGAVFVEVGGIGIVLLLLPPPPSSRRGPPSGAEPGSLRGPRASRLLITKRQFLDACRHEISVVKHLATKVPADRLDWRPTPGQRSILELLRYLSACAVVPVRAMIAGSWDHAEAIERATEGVGLETFGEAMDVQANALEEMLAPLSESDLLEREATLPWGAKARLGEALLTTGLKTLTAYRMQLFLYAKQSGASALGPTNCWIGVDRPS